MSEQTIRLVEALALPSHLTDIGNAERFARDHSSFVKYATGLGFLVWDGTRWRVDELGEVERLARDTVKSIYAEASYGADQGERAKIARWAKDSESHQRIRAMLSLAKSELTLVKKVEAFDRHPWLLNTASGVIDLKSGHSVPHSPDVLITKLAPTFYNAGLGVATCPKWLTFLDRIMGGNLDLIEFLQRAVGYALTGDVSEQVFFFLYGSGANGKSTWLEVIRSVLGDYATHASAESFMERKPGSIPNDLARLRGARFLTAVEVEDGRKLAEGLVKQMTGGDVIVARFMHKEFFEFYPEFKIFLAANHKPVIRGTDYAIWRRVRLVPFTVCIPEQDRDKDLVRKLLTEAEGILAWAVEGCLQWQKGGLQAPDAVLAATKSYKEEMDPINPWLEERCDVDATSHETSALLYTNYRFWAKDNGRHEISNMRFSAILEEKGFRKERKTAGIRFVGLRLKTNRGEL